MIVLKGVANKSLVKKGVTNQITSNLTLLKGVTSNDAGSDFCSFGHSFVPSSCLKELFTFEFHSLIEIRTTEHPMNDKGNKAKTIECKVA